MPYRLLSVTPAAPRTYEIILVRADEVIECDELFAAAHEPHEHGLQQFGSRCREVLIVAVQDLPVETNDAG